MGAPVKPPEERRTIKKQVSFNPAEFEALERARGDVPFARWLREAGLEKAGREHQPPDS